MNTIVVCLLVGLVAPPGRPLYVDGPMGTILGRVVEQATQRPICDASVVVDGTHAFAMTSRDGTFRINRVPVGSHTVKIKARGLRAVEVHGLWVTSNATAFIPMVVLRDHPNDSCPGEFDVVRTDDHAFVAQMLSVDMVPRLPPQTDSLLPLPSRDHHRYHGAWIVREERHRRRVVRGISVSWEDVRETRSVSGRIDRADAVSNATSR